MTFKTAVQTLVEAKLCDESKLSPGDKERLNRLSEDEVQQLIALHNKLGPAESDEARPAFPL